MSALEQIRALYGYNEWANNHILDASSELSEEELKRSQGASFDSIRGNLAHTVGAQIIWLGRWSGERSEALALLGGDPSLDDIRRSYEMSHDELRRFVESLNEQGLSRAVPYTGTARAPAARWCSGRACSRW
ncbi:MAG: DinB family protein [Chloroflexi bacterium]|nr:DinB family protein [Chloroflexota bacterium]